MFDRNTNWGRLTLEVVAIVSSILLAFAIDAWWQELQEQRFEDEVIQALTDEYEANRRVLSFIRDVNLKMRRATASLISASHRGVSASDEFSIDETVHWARIPPTTDLGNSVRDTLMAERHCFSLTGSGRGSPRRPLAWSCRPQPKNGSSG
jgi:hypothetical protein